MTTKLMFLALIPGILIIIFIYGKDKVEREPVGLIFKLILFGAISCVPAAIAERFMSVFVVGTSGLYYALTEAFIVAALCEEICKFIFLRLGSWKHRAFDYRFDAVVYSVSIAVGFALLENVLYVAEGGLETALMRGVLAVPLHAFCGVYMGVYYGLMKKLSIRGKHIRAFFNMIQALIIPIMIHGIYDTLAFLENGLASIGLLIFVGLMYVNAIKKVNQLSREDIHGCFYDIPFGANM